MARAIASRSAHPASPASVGGEVEAHRRRLVCGVACGARVDPRARGGVDPEWLRAAAALREPRGHAAGIVEEDTRAVVGDELRGEAPVAHEHRAARAGLLAPDRIDGRRRVLAGKAREEQRGQQARGPHRTSLSRGVSGVGEVARTSRAVASRTMRPASSSMTRSTSCSISSTRCEQRTVTASCRGPRPSRRTRRGRCGRGWRWARRRRGLGLGGERQRGEELLAHAAREIAEARRARVGSSRASRGARRAPAAPSIAAQRRDGADDLQHRRLDGRRDLRDVRDRPERELRLPRDVDAAEAHVPLDADQAEHCAQERRLARPVRADESHPLTRLDVQAHVVESLHDAERLGDVADVDHRDFTVRASGPSSRDARRRGRGARPARGQLEPRRR